MHTQTLEFDIAFGEQPPNDEAYNNRLACAAMALLGFPRQLDILNYYLDEDGYDSDEIHSRLGGSKIDGDEYYERNFGTVIAPDGTIYRLRIDDCTRLQLYVSPTDERGKVIDVMQPFVYDGSIVPHAKWNDVRVDFLNGRHACLPQNTQKEREAQMMYGRSVTLPVHRGGADFIPGRDSLLIRSLNVETLEVGERSAENLAAWGWMHSGADGTVTELFRPTRVRAVARGILSAIDTATRYNVTD